TPRIPQLHRAGEPARTVRVPIVERVLDDEIWKLCGALRELGANACIEDLIVTRGLGKAPGIESARARGRQPPSETGAIAIGIEIHEHLVTARRLPVERRLRYRGGHRRREREVWCAEEILDPGGREGIDEGLGCGGDVVEHCNRRALAE